MEISVKTIMNLTDELGKVKDDDYADYVNTQWRIYVSKLCEEQESLIARFLNEHKDIKPSDVCIVEMETPTGKIFYPDLRKNHEQKS